jgi:hypothetical protein
VIPIWLIEADVFGRSFEPIKAEIRRQGLAWEIVHPGPFLNGLVPSVGGHRLIDGDCVVFSGTYSLMRYIQLHRAWVPGGWCATEQFDFAHYYPFFGRHLLNQPNAILTVEEASSGVEAIFQRFAVKGQVFVRPCGVQKVFTGRCVDREEFVGALETASFTRAPILVAAPRQIDQEWRVVVARDRMIAASRYRLEGRLDVSPGCPWEVCAFVEALLADVRDRPDPIYLIDVCTSGSDLYLLELNSFSCSGLYQCDPPAVVTEVKRLATEAWDKAKSHSEGSCSAVCPRPS